MRAIVRQKLVRANYCDPAIITWAPYHLGSAATRRARPNHQHTLRRRFRLARWFLIGLARDENMVASLFDFPARCVAQCRRGNRFASAQIKASVVPWTPHRAIDHQPFRERPAIVRAFRADGEQFLS